MTESVATFFSLKPWPTSLNKQFLLYIFLKYIAWKRASAPPGSLLKIIPGLNPSSTELLLLWYRIRLSVRILAKHVQSPRFSSNHGWRGRKQTQQSVLEQTHQVNRSLCDTHMPLVPAVKRAAGDYRIPAPQWLATLTKLMIPEFIERPVSNSQL